MPGHSVLRRARKAAPRLFVLVLAAAGLPAAAPAAPPADYPLEDSVRPDGIHILDGSYVLDEGEFQVNITNHGLIGSQFSAALPYSEAPSGQWPGGSGDEYLWGAGLWIGARVGGELAVTTGQYDRELRPEEDLRSTIYEALEGVVTRPYPSDKVTGRRFPDALNDDDGDGRMDEDPLNGLDDDRDGLIDEDFGQLGTQVMACVMRDDLPLISEIYPAHRPLGVTVYQQAFTWYQDEYDDIVGLDFLITNTGHETLTDVYLGFFVDCDIQRRSDSDAAPDDLAGFSKSARRGSDDTFYDLQVAWMRDGATENPLPGCLGVVLIDHPTDFRRQSEGPKRVGTRSFNIFATNAAVNQDGEPLSDQDRYAVMSGKEFDRDRRPDLAADLKFLISSGPFTYLPPGRSLHYRLAMVMGDGFDDMLDKALLAAEIGRGGWMDLDDQFWTGQGRKESLVCLGDWPPSPDGTDPLIGYKIDMMDETCVGSQSYFGYLVIAKDIMEPQPDGRTCIWVNLDNCEECFRRHGVECTMQNQLYFAEEDPWWWGRPYPAYYTGVNGKEHHVPWIHTTELPPPPPAIRVMPGDKRVEVFWDDASEWAADFRRGVPDFESYRVWRVFGWVRPQGASEVLGPPSTAWGMIAEYDLINTVPAALNHGGTELPLGRNTGLQDIVYVPVCLSDERFAGLAEVMRTFVEADVHGEFTSMPPLRNANGTVRPETAVFLPWEFAPDVLDTFFAVTPRQAQLSPPLPGKRATGYYHYLDTEIHNGFTTYYAVTAADHALALVDGQWMPAGSGIQAEPGNNFVVTMPGPTGQSVASYQEDGRNIYVYPNPATRESLAEFQKLPPGYDDPTGERIMFNNLPAAHNSIRIYTASGDHVITLEHDGLTRGGYCSWNLVSRNGQEVTSGIYIYVVQSDNPAFPDFQGRFVVIK